MERTERETAEKGRRYGLVERRNCSGIKIVNTQARQQEYIYHVRRTHGSGIDIQIEAPARFSQPTEDPY
jgi:hypothetical protein